MTSEKDADDDSSSRSVSAQGAPSYQLQDPMHDSSGFGKSEPVPAVPPTSSPFDHCTISAPHPPDATIPEHYRSLSIVRAASLTSFASARRAHSMMTPTIDTEFTVLIDADSTTTRLSSKLGVTVCETGVVGSCSTSHIAPQQRQKPGKRNTAWRALWDPPFCSHDQRGKGCAPRHHSFGPPRRCWLSTIRPPSHFECVIRSIASL